MGPGRVHTVGTMQTHAWAVGIRIAELELKPEPGAPRTRHFPGSSIRWAAWAEDRKWVTEGFAAQR